MPFTKQETSSGNILIYKIDGVVTEADYKDNLLPEMQKIIDQHQQVRLLCDIVDFSIVDMEWMAMWEDAKFGFTKARHISHFAVICKHNQLAQAFKLLFIGINFQSFSPSQRYEALQWICQDSQSKAQDIIKLDSKICETKREIPFLHTTKFMVAVGRGEASRVALGHALNLLRSNGTEEELHLVTVLDSAGQRKELSDVMENAVHEVESLLGPRSEESRMRLRVSRHLLEPMKNQSIASVLSETAKKLGIDYIIMGTEHCKQSLINSLFTSSVALEVLKSAPCPVLICQPNQEAMV